MNWRTMLVAASLISAHAALAQSTKAADVTKFMGRAVVLTAPKPDPATLNLKDFASVCLEGPPERQCYSAPEAFWDSPQVSLVDLGEGTSALLFSAQTRGISGWQTQLALLRPGASKDLDDMFAMVDASLSNQSRHAFWTNAAISDAPIFVTAEYVLGADEAHYTDHRYIISAYVLTSSVLLQGKYYFLGDRYMTVRKYGMGDDILASEKPEIFAGLKRAKAGR